MGRRGPKPTPAVNMRLRLPPELHAKLRAYCELSQQTLQDFVLDAVRHKWSLVAKNIEHTGVAVAAEMDAEVTGPPEAARSGSPVPSR